MTGEPRRRKGSVYVAAAAADAEALAAKHRLAEDLRRLADTLVGVDAANAGTAAFEELRSVLAAAQGALDALPVVESRDDHEQVPEASLAERGPMTGRSNALAAPLHLELAGEVTTGWAVYRRGYEGQIGIMHGGVIAAAFDDVLGCAQMAAPFGGPTGTLTVRYLAPIPIGRRIDYVGRVERVEGRKVFCTGEASTDGRTLARAEAVFIARRD